MSGSLRRYELVLHMSRGNENQTETFPLQNALLCIDCESVINCRCDECPVCGGHSLHSLARILGGSLLEDESARFGRQVTVLFDLHITVELKRVEARDLNAAIEGITGVIGPLLGRRRASLHVNVEPAEDSCAADRKVA